MQCGHGVQRELVEAFDTQPRATESTTHVITVLISYTYAFGLRIYVSEKWFIKPLARDPYYSFAGGHPSRSIDTNALLQYRRRVESG
jgi:hypothetical protein